MPLLSADTCRRALDQGYLLHALCGASPGRGHRLVPGMRPNRSEGVVGHSPAAGPPPSLLQSGCHQLLTPYVLIAKMGTRVVTPVELRSCL